MKAIQPPTVMEVSLMTATQKNYVLYMIQRNRRSRMIVVHLDSLASSQGIAQDECPYGVGGGGAEQESP
jgi:hypothetical protein